MCVGNLFSSSLPDQFKINEVDIHEECFSNNFIIPKIISGRFFQNVVKAEACTNVCDEAFLQK